MARDLVKALIDLLNVQNDFLSVWVDHEVQRLQLDFDLGIMELDANGQRIEHKQPLRTFVDDGMCLAPFELPAPCKESTADLPECAGRESRATPCRRSTCCRRTSRPTRRPCRRLRGRSRCGCRSAAISR